MKDEKVHNLYFNTATKGSCSGNYNALGQSSEPIR